MASERHNADEREAGLPDLDALKRLAEAACPEPDHIYTHPRDDNNWLNNQRWQLAASPDVVLALIARIKALEEVAEAGGLLCANLCRGGVGHMRLVEHFNDLRDSLNPPSATAAEPSERVKDTP